jgi:beta-lactamase regulating signal transducer with metallopeptidase domain
MATDVLSGLGRTNLALGIAILVVLGLRAPARRLFGARLAYALWILPVLTAFATLLPGPRPSSPMAISAAFTTSLTPHLNRTPFTQATAIDVAGTTGPNWSLPLLALWIAGTAVSLGLLVARQRRFRSMLGDIRRASDSDSELFVASNPTLGPAVVGAFRPRVILPSDFTSRFTVEEQPLVLAHERAHLSAGDAHINLLVVLMQCVNWFNPLVHTAARLVRLDQELACDATVVARHPSARKLYAEAMVKSHLTFTGSPLGCSWQSRGGNPLKKRIAMLKHQQPGPGRRWAGVCFTVTLCLGAGYTAWASQPVGRPAAESTRAPEPRRAGVASTPADQLPPQARTAAAVVLGALHELTAGNAVQENDAAAVAAGIQSGANVNAYRPGDGTPLVRAARHGDLEVVKLLLEHGADPNLEAPGDGNPLIMAAAHGHMDIVSLLVESGADVNGYVAGDETPLINAAGRGHLDVVKYLVDRGADVDLAYDVPSLGGAMERRSPLGQAVKFGRTAVAEYLRARGAKP